jgi:hypothetical protein
MGRASVVLAMVMLVALCAAAAADAKGGYWLRICGESGCKVVKDQLVGAALSTEAETRGSTVRFPSRGAVYSVRYVIAPSGEVTGRTYWLTTETIDFLIASSQPSVGKLFVRATADVRPFPGASSSAAESSTSWVWVVGAGGAIAAVVAVVLLRWRRVRLSVRTTLRP